MLPAQTLHSASVSGSRRRLKQPYLCDAQRSPLLLPQQLQCASRAVKVVLGNDLEHLLRELHVTVFILFVRVPASSVSLGRVAPPALGSTTHLDE